jgi:hypothetical protein
MAVPLTKRSHEDVVVPIPQRTREETLAEFDAQARQVLQMSGEEFLRRLDAGELDDVIDDPAGYPGITYLLMLSDHVR